MNDTTDLHLEVDIFLSDTSGHGRRLQAVEWLIELRDENNISQKFCDH
jgi:hypothetical protein